MNSKKDVKFAKEIFVKGISNASFKNNYKLRDILTFIFKELDNQFPENNETNRNLN